MEIIYAIPGLGTTKELYSFIKAGNAELKVLDWPQYDENETLQSYARKLAMQIDDSKPFYLMGVSYGGMLCTEISRIKAPRKAFLISTCEFESELPWALKLFRYFPLYELVSDKMHRALARHAKFLLGFSDAYKNDFYKMVDAMPKGYFKSSVRNIMQWKSSGEARNAVRIHGNKDKLIWFTGSIKKRTHYVIDSGTHAMILYKAKEINAILDDFIK